MWYTSVDLRKRCEKLGKLTRCVKSAGILLGLLFLLDTFWVILSKDLCLLKKCIYINVYNKTPRNDYYNCT